MKSARIVGVFTLGAFFLGAALIIFVGSLQLFSQKETFLLYFDESINGLAVGAPVKFKGVPVGEVTEIKIRYNQFEWSTGIPVFIEIDTTRLQTELGVEVDIGNEEQHALAVRDGLRGKLEVASLISGQLFIELDYVQPPIPEPVFGQMRIEYKEIPTVPSALAQIGATTSEIVAQITSIDVRGINEQTMALLKNLNEKVAETDVAGLTESLKATSDELRAIAQGDALGRVLDEIEATGATYRALAETVDGEVVTTGASVRAGLDQLNTTLATIDRAAGEVESLLASDSELSHEALELMRELRIAASNLTQFVSYLERNPRALITGRETP